MVTGRPPSTTANRVPLSCEAIGNGPRTRKNLYNPKEWPRIGCAIEAVFAPARGDESADFLRMIMPLDGKGKLPFKRPIRACPRQFPDRSRADYVMLVIVGIAYPSTGA